MKNLLILFLSFFSINLVYGQNAAAPDTSKVHVENADYQLTEYKNKEYIQYLKGNVRAVQDSIYLFCDTATLKANQMTALGDIVILQGDSIQVFSDSLYYNGDSKLAKLFYNVVLQNNESKVFSNALVYDLESRIAIIPDTCLFQKNELQLNSLRAVFNVDQNLVYFYEEVTVINNNFKLKADSLMYDSELDRVYFIAPSYIEQDGKRIFCEEGYYDVKDERAFFDDNPVYFDGDKVARARNMYSSAQDSIIILSGKATVKDSLSFAKANIITIDNKTGDVTLEDDAEYIDQDKTIRGPRIVYNENTKDVLLEGRSRIYNKEGFIDGDTIRYDKASDLGKVIGSPEWRDTVNDRVLEGGQFYYKEENSYFKAVKTQLRPLLRQKIDEDTLYLSADTLLSANIGDSLSYLMAVRNVRIFKNDLQAVCDSLYYSDRDSTFKLFFNPVAWSDTTQFEGDTLLIKLESDEVREILSQSNAFIASRDAYDFYNQIKGRQIRARLDSNKIQRMDVKGNAESIYFMKDEEEAYVGPMKTTSTEMAFIFENDSLRYVNCSPDNESILTPMKIASQSDFVLTSFEWQEDNRPIKWQDVLKFVKNRRNSGNTLKNKEVEDGDEFEREVKKATESLSRGLNKKRREKDER